MGVCRLKFLLFEKLSISTLNSSIFIAVSIIVETIILFFHSGRRDQGVVAHSRL